MMTQAPPSDLFTRMTERYANGEIPWHHELPPPEVIALAESLPPGRFLDLGSGLGRACIYMAQRGWTCDGVDFIAQATQMSRERAEAAGVADRVHFHTASVAALEFLSEPYDLILDVGCLHAQTPEDGQAYAKHVKRLLKPSVGNNRGGQYVLFAHLTNESDPDARQWTTEEAVYQLFLPDLTLERIERGTTTTVESTWQSAWLWMHA